MEYGLIKDTTLTALADGFRDKRIIPETRPCEVELDYEHYYSSNCTSPTDPTPRLLITDEKINIEAIPNAHSVEFVFTFETVTTFSPGNTLGQITVKQGSYQIARTAVLTGITEAEKTFSVKPDPYYGGGPFTVALSMPYNDANCYGVIFDVYALDAEGNRIKIRRPAEEKNTVTPEAMVEAITNFDMPIALPEEAFVLTGDCSYRFASGGWDWFVDLYGDKITTVDISNLLNTFQKSKLERIPFTINVKNCENVTPFNSMIYLVETPKIRGTLNGTTDLSTCIEQCYKLRDIEDLFEPEMLDFFREYKCTSSYTCPRPVKAYYCYSLRRLPSWWNKFRLNPESTALPATTYAGYLYNFNSCYALDEIRDLPVWTCNSTTAALTSNMFSSCFYGASRLKSLTFELVNGQPVTTRWKAQVIELNSYVGYVSHRSSIAEYNSGITADKEVTNDATYQALKNDPDWFTTKIEYSRYNHDSAVETINSLPDTSAYLASAGGTNTIKFKKTAGSLTDGGAIENLTAEEIAVAAAKGWTVTLV